MFKVKELLQKIEIPFKKEKKENLIKDIKESPENYLLMAYIENDEVVIKIKKKS